jgi:hypothetical protein
LNSLIVVRKTCVSMSSRPIACFAQSWGVGVVGSRRGRIAIKGLLPRRQRSLFFSRCGIPTELNTSIDNLEA